MSQSAESGAPELTLDTASSVTDLLRSHALHRAGKEAVIQVRDPDKLAATSISYKELDARARALAHWLQQNNPEGSRILLLYPVGIEFVVAFIACIYAGMIAVPAPLPTKYRHQQARLRAIADDAGIAAVFTDSVNHESVLDWARTTGLTDLPCLVTDCDELGDPVLWEKPDCTSQTIALLQYTSGSTGDPKGVMIHHGNLLANVASFRAGLGFDENTRFGGWIPLYHDMGLMAQLLPALFLGSTCVMMTPATFLKRPHLWLRMIDRYNVNHSCAPNFAFDLCRRRVSPEQRDSLDLSHWDFVVNGSEPIQASTFKSFLEYFSQAGLKETALCPCYGMAEATVYISGVGTRAPVQTTVESEALERNHFIPTTSTENARVLVSSGRAPELEVRIVDPDSRKVLDDRAIGEIWLRGESISPGYWGRPEATEETFRARTADGDSGYLRTGDLGTLDDGEIYVTGRRKEVLIFNGRNHYPQDIEHELRSQIEELRSRFGAVFSITLGDGRESLVITHEVHGRTNDEDLLRIAASIKLISQQIFGLNPGAIVLLKSGGVLRTTSGKIQRTAMKNAFLSDELRPLFESLNSEVSEFREGWVRRSGASYGAVEKGVAL